MMVKSSIRNFCIIAHIDAGKSTLADRFLELTNTVSPRQMKEQLLDQMDLEREHGVTIKMAPVRMLWHSPMQNENSEFILNEVKNKVLERQQEVLILNLIDTPGHIDFSYEVSRALAAVEGAILLIDGVKGVQAQTIANLRQAIQQKLTIIPAINKKDLPSFRGAEIKEQLQQLADKWHFQFACPENEWLEISAKTGEEVPKLLEQITKYIPSPKLITNSSLTNNSFRGLIFDSAYHQHLGVIAYIRVFSGQIKNGAAIKTLSTQTIVENVKVGTFNPWLQETEKLSDGEIGWIATGLKDVSQIAVGDTIVYTTDDSPRPLSGYQPPRPMVYASFYPQGENDIGTLRTAMERLRLTDAAIDFQPENHPALGSGFRVGCLGTFHLEITKERLWREWHIPIIITQPQVNYQSNSEPWVRAEIVTPPAAIGRIMKLCQQQRGQEININYLGNEVLLEYDLPLAEIISGFYDDLKSVSNGYASLSYQVSDWRPAELVTLETIIANEKIPALNKIIVVEKMINEARQLAEKLRTILPRQLFEVKIQIGTNLQIIKGITHGKILASERIPALRKDVIAKLYGGDRTRKDKLLQRQTAGKKRLARLGRLTISDEVYLQLLRP